MKGLTHVISPNHIGWEHTFCRRNPFHEVRFSLGLMDHEHKQKGKAHGREKD